MKFTECKLRNTYEKSNRLSFLNSRQEWLRACNNCFDKENCQADINLKLKQILNNNNSKSDEEKH